MKAYTYRAIMLIVALVVLTVAATLLLLAGWYWLGSGLALLVLTVAVILFRYATRPGKDLKRFISAIRFSEFNVSFQSSSAHGLDERLVKKMEKAISVFNQRNLHKEAELNFYEVLLNRIDFAIIVANARGEITWINKSAIDIFGKPQPRRIADIKGISQLLGTLTPKDVQMVKLKRGGTDINLAITVALINIEGIDMRIYSMKNIQPILDETENEAWRKLIRILTHEIMNSLTPIISLAETFSQETDEPDTEMLQKAIQTIHRRSKGLIGFINNYQRLTKLPDPNKSIFSIKEMIEEVAHLLKAQHVQFAFVCDAANVLVKADRTQIEQVLINLIKNAWEACADREVPSVTVHIKNDEYQQVILSVSDNGVGILPEVLDKIFIPFFTTRPMGSGIGLNICRQIINAHRGSISVTSEPDKGTCFVVKL